MLKSARDERDAAHWDEVEEATELLAEGKVAHALLALRKVILASPDNAYAYHYLGVGLFESNELEPARDAYRAAITLAPGYLAARTGLAHVLRMLGDTRGSLREANEALRRFPDDAEARYAAGLAQAALGHRTQAKRELEAFLARGPELEASLEVRQILEMLGLGEEGEPFALDEARPERDPSAS